MLIRVSGGNSGIKEYLEEGVKNGRDYTRDELDQRVILAGDLEATNDVIQRIDSDHERYMHVTLSFKEDHIDESILQSITDEFRQFIMSAYDDDEYSFYAEAHLPKIKTLVDSKSGELVERKPHIHIVIPEINLRTNQRLEPLGKVDHNKSYLDAFQEVINEKYGLASPKVHVRGKFTDESTLSQGEVFAGANKHVKQSVLTQIITHDIRSQDALKTHLLEQGFQVKARNPGKPDSYLNIKSPGSPKGVNLKDNVFQSTFLALPAHEKQAQLQTTTPSQYLSPGKPYKAPERAHQTLELWHTQRAAEVRFTTCRNRKTYQALSQDDQHAFLTQKQEAARGVPTPSIEPRHPRRDAEHDLRTAGEYLSDAQRDRDGIKPGVRRIVDRRAVRTVCAALQRCERHQEPPRSLAVPERQRSDNPVNHYQQQREQVAQAKLVPLTHRVCAAPLLQYLAQTHGVQPEKYPITTGKDGRDRIVCGNRKLNVSDFLTKEMSLSWKEAQAVLAQHENARPHSRKQFTEQWQPTFSQQRKNAWQAQISQEKHQRTTRYDEYKTEKNAIYGDNSLSRIERKAALSVARMNKVLADMEYQSQRQAARQRLKEAYPSTPQAQYQRFENRHQQTEGHIMETTLHGQLLDHGTAPYEFKEENKQSYFIKVKQPNQKVRTVWGAGLSSALEKSQAQRGDDINLTRNDNPSLQKHPIVNWEIQKMENVKTHEHASQEKAKPIPEKPIELTNKVLDEKLQASRLLVHYPKLKEMGVGPEHIQKTDSGDKINYNDKAYSVTQLMRETHSLSPKKVNDELKLLYEAQERDQARMRAYKENYMTQVREPLPREPRDNNAPTKEIPDAVISAKDKTQRHAPLPARDFDDITHKTDAQGNVSYFHAGKEIVVDRGNAVYTSSEENKAVEIGLRLSIEKFGKTLDVQGTPEYKAQITDIAVKNNLKIEFTDPAMNEMMAQKQAQHHKGMNIIQQARSQRENKPSPIDQGQQQTAQQTQKPGTTWTR